MCECCKDYYSNKPILDTRTKLSNKGDFYPGIEVDIVFNKLSIVAVADVYEPGYVETDININYCPMCR